MLYWHADQQLTVHQNNRYRWLNLGHTVQTVMDLGNPARPVLPHLHAMLMALYLRPEPRSVLELGLGGGALCRWFAHQPEPPAYHCIEYSDPIIHCFHEYFNPDALAPHLQKADAKLAIRQHQHQDLLLVDLFGEGRQPEFLSRSEFYHHCLESLSPDGVLVVNLLSHSQLQINHIRQKLAILSGQAVQLIHVPGYHNHLLLASPAGLPPLRYCSELEDFAAQHGLNLEALRVID